MSSSGLPGFDTRGFYALFAPAGTPAPLINRIETEFNRALQRPDMKAQILRSGSEPLGTTPEELAALLKSEIARWGRLFKAQNIRGK